MTLADVIDDNSGGLVIVI